MNEARESIPGLWNPRRRRIGRGGEGRGVCVGAGNRVRSHRRRQHRGYYTSVTPPSKLQKFYKTQRSSHDYVLRDLWPGLCIARADSQARLYCVARNKVLRFLTPRYERRSGIPARDYPVKKLQGVIRNNGNLIFRKIVLINNCLEGEGRKWVGHLLFVSKHYSCKSVWNHVWFYATH